MLLRLISIVFLLTGFGLSVAAEDDQDLVRLPGQGELKTEAGLQNGPGRLVPGGGLLLSFDANSDGAITTEELDTGILAAFKVADHNEDGRITPLEQVKWTETLPTRDQSLANPARFDPNLDRSVKVFEFEEIVRALAATYADPATGTVRVAALQTNKLPISAQQDAFPEN